MLPPSLRNEVLSNTYGEIVGKIKFFIDMKDADFLWKLLPLLKPIKLEKNDILYWKGDHANESTTLHINLNSVLYPQGLYEALHRKGCTLYQV